MPRFLLAHAVENRRRRGKILPQAFGKIGIDAFVFFFQRDRQGQQFALGQAVKIAHLRLPPEPRVCYRSLDCTQRIISQEIGGLSISAPRAETMVELGHMPSGMRWILPTSTGS